MRKLIATLVVLALILIGADFAGRLIAEQKAGDALSSELSASTSHDPATDTSVDIGGFSFLLQAVQGDYSHIAIDATKVTLGPIDGARLHADLYDVHFPLSDAFSGSLDHLAADRATVRATIPSAALASALQRPGMTLSSGGDGLIRMHTTVAAAGRTFPVTVDVAVSVTDNALHLAARPVSAADVTIPAQIAGPLRQQLTRTIPLSALPFPLDSATVTAGDGDLTVAARASDVQIGKLVAAG